MFMHDLCVETLVTLRLPPPRSPRSRPGALTAVGS